MSIKNKINNLILKVNKNAISFIEETAEKHKISFEKETFIYCNKIIKNYSLQKYYLPFITTFLICLIQKKAPKTNTIALSALFLIIEHFLDLPYKQAQKNSKHLAGIASIIILEELNITPSIQIEILKKIKKIVIALKKDNGKDLKNIDRLIKIKITDSIKHIVDFISLMFLINQEQINKLKIYSENISRIIYFEKKEEFVTQPEVQKLQMMQDQGNKILNKFETTGKETLKDFSDSLMENIKSNADQKSLAI